MANVTHTVKVNYGSYSGTTTVFCDENDDNEQIAAKVKRQHDLNFLPMYSWSMKIVDTKRYEDDDDD